MNTYDTDGDRVSQSIKSVASRQAVSQNGSRKSAINHFNSTRKFSHDQSNIKRDPFLNEINPERHNKLSTTSQVFNQSNVQMRSFSNNILQPDNSQNVNNLIGLALSRKQISGTYHHDAYPYFLRS